MAQGSDAQACAVRMQMGETKGEFDTALLLIEADRQFVGELGAQAADIARRRRGSDMAGRDARRADAIAAAEVGMALGCQGVAYGQPVVGVEGGPLSQGAAAGLGIFHDFFPNHCRPRPRCLRGVRIKSSTCCTPSGHWPLICSYRTVLNPFWLHRRSACNDWFAAPGRHWCAARCRG